MILCFTLLQLVTGASPTMFPMSPVVPSAHSSTSSEYDSEYTVWWRLSERLKRTAEELGEVQPLRAHPGVHQNVRFIHRLRSIYFFGLPGEVRQFIETQESNDRANPDSVPLLRFNQEVIELPEGKVRIHIGSRIASRTGSTVFNVLMPGPALVIKYQANCDSFGVEHPLIRDYWFQRTLAPLQIGPAVHFLSPAARLPRDVTLKTTFHMPYGEYLECAADMRSHVRYMVMDRVSSVVFDYVQIAPTVAPLERFLTAIRVMSGVMMLLQRIHAANVIHGDIHPGNVVVHNRKVGLIDFGNARFGSELENEPILTDLSYMHCFYTPFELDGFPYAFRDDVFRTLIVGAMMLHGQPFVDHCVELERDRERMHFVKKESFLFDFQGDVTEILADEVSELNRTEIRSHLQSVLDLARAPTGAANILTKPPYSLILHSLNAIKLLLE